MNIGIVTFFNVRNYGAMLQAYSLWQYLSKRGHSVHFLNYPWGNSIRPGFPRRLIDRNLRIHRAELERFYNHRMTEFSQTFPVTQLVSSKHDAALISQHWDVAVVGSDQMWNPNWTPPERIPIVFLDFVCGNTRRIAYAVSFGETEWNRPDAKEIEELLGKFSAVSVRERSGAALINRLAGVDAVCVPDPTLLHDAQFYSKLLNQSSCLGRPYIFKYILYHPGEVDESGVCVRACVEALGIKNVVSDRALPYGILNKALCLLTGVRPQVAVYKWLARLAMSAFVVTNSFHGIVFSIIFHRPFVAILLKGRLSGMNERISTLLHQVGLPERMVNADDTAMIDMIAKQGIAWRDVDERIAQLRRKAESFIRGQGL